MTSPPAAPAPGSMTVPPFFGWEVVLTVLVVLVVIAVISLVISSTGTGRDERPEWQAWLDSRSSRRGDRTKHPHDHVAQVGRRRAR